MVEKEETEDEDEESAHRAASSLLDELAVDIPSKHIFRPIVEHSIKLTKSQNYLDRKAGITALGVYIFFIIFII